MKVTPQASAPAKLEINQINPPLCDPRDGIGNGDSGILLEHASHAKAKVVNAKARNEWFAFIMAMSPRYSAIKSALSDYVLLDDPLATIAKRHGHTAPAIAYWIRKPRLPARRRGRRTLLKPTSIQQRILELVRAHGTSETARRVGLSRQRVHQIVARWSPKLIENRKVPKSLERPRPTRGSRRTVVVSFRISNEEFFRLSASEVTSTGDGLSAFEKAREIVLKFIAPLGREGQEPIQSLVNLSAIATNFEAGNVYENNAG